MESQAEELSGEVHRDAVATLVDDMETQILARASRPRTRTEEYDESEDYGDDVEVVTDYYDEKHVLREIPRRHDRELVYISADELSRHYGGPEEGGWWYDTGAVVDYAPVLVLYNELGNPYLRGEERQFIEGLARKWISEHGAFGESNRNSMAPRGRDLYLRATYEVSEDWSDYAPYC